MKTSLPLLALLASLALGPTLHADLMITQQVEGMGQNMESTTKIKGSKTRVDASPATSIIMDLKSGDMISLMHSQKKFMKIPSQMTQAAFDGMKKMQGGKGGLTPTPTGKKDVISGYASEEYTSTVAGTKITLWLTKALPDYQQVLKEMGVAFSQGPMAAMMKNLGVDFTTLPGFPIRTVNEIQPGQSMTTTVTSVSIKPLPDSDFEVPADYQAMTMPSLTPPAAAAPAVSK